MPGDHNLGPDASLLDIIRVVNELLTSNKNKVGKVTFERKLGETKSETIRDIVAGAPEALNTLNEIAGSLDTRIKDIKLTPGPKGDPGSTGEPGPKGDPGLAGDKGKDGANALSVISNMYFPSPLNYSTGIAPLRPPLHFINQAASVGWYFKNTAGQKNILGQSSNKFTYIFPALSNMKYSDLSGFYFTYFNGLTSTDDNSPFLTVYTKFTGVNDGYPNYYHSKRTFTLPANPTPNTFICGLVNINNSPDPIITHPINLVYLVKTPVTSPADGPDMLPDEDISHFAINTNSTAEVDKVECCISKFGVISTKNIIEFLLHSN